MWWRTDESFCSYRSKQRLQLVCRQQCALIDKHATCEHIHIFIALLPYVQLFQCNLFSALRRAGELDYSKKFAISNSNRTQGPMRLATRWCPLICISMPLRRLLPRPHPLHLPLLPLFYRLAVVPMDTTWWLRILINMPIAQKIEKQQHVLTFKFVVGGWQDYRNWGEHRE